MDCSLPSNNPINAFLPIYERYVDEASFLWVLLRVALSQPHYYLDDIRTLEARIARQLDGIMTDPNAAWPLCEEALRLEEPGEAFTASFIAFCCGDIDKIQTVVETAINNEAMFGGLVSALNWVAAEKCHPWIMKFFSSKDLRHKRIALEACDLRNENPAKYLTNIIQREDCRQNLPLYISAIKSIGKFKRKELIDDVKIALVHDDSAVKFWAVHTLFLLGERSHYSEIKHYVMVEGPFRDEAIQLAFRVLPITEARTWIRELAEKQPGSREIIKATAVLGDPHAVPWLIMQMKNTSLSRLAGESFTTITGINLTDNELVDEDKTPEDFSEDDSFVAMDEDENLPFPIPNKIAEHWKKVSSRFISGHRYFMGKPINVSQLNNQFEQLNTRHKHMAALELALSQATIQLRNNLAKNTY